MYRIRSATGTEAVYNSLEEFHEAVRHGQVAPEDEIFHSRANRWLDVKSHPHYRSVIGWLGTGDAATVPPPALTPVAPVRGVSSPPPAPRPAPQQTVMRPQLLAESPAPKATAPTPAPAAPPRKSKELAFIDLGDTQPGSRQHATVMQAQKAPVATATTKPAPVAPQGTELQFLVMDGGIESPVRNSSGHRTVPEDLDLLFEPESPAAAQPAASTAASPKVQPPKAAVAHAPAPKVEAPKVEAPKVEAQKVEAAKVEALKVEVPKVETPKVEAPKVAVPKPEPIKVSSPKLEVIRPAAPLDLDIPAPALMTEPLSAAAPHPAPDRAGNLRKGMLVGAGAFIVVLGVAVAAWKPWSRDGALASGPPAATTTGAESVPGAVPGNPTAAGSIAGSGTGTPSEGGARTAAFGAPAGLNRTSDPVLPPKTDSVEPEVEVIAARPAFRPTMDMSTAGLSVGTDIPAAASTARGVAPSELARRLTHAERETQQELVAKLGGFRALLAPERIGSADGAARARAAWIAGGDAIRQYRSRIARLTQAYEDSVLTSQRSQRWPADEMRAWGSRPSLSETAETAQLADLMISQVNEGLELLAALDGKYQIKGGRMVFGHSGSIPRYLSIRTWVDQRMSVWQATPENARPYTLNAILRALGDGFPAAQ